MRLERTMSHPADFADAHARHWEDAELLFRSARWANADHLYGFSAECGLKAVMEDLGMPVDRATGIPQEAKHRKHVQELWPEFQTFAQGRLVQKYSRFLAPGSPFADWSHHDRYAHQTHFDRSVVIPHREAARKISSMVITWKLDGSP